MSTKFKHESLNLIEKGNLNGMKVLIVGPSKSEHTLRWIERLSSHDIRIHLLDMNQAEASITNGSFIHVPPSMISSKIWHLMNQTRKLGPFGVILKIPILLMYLPFFNAWLRKESFDVINVHWLLHPLALLVMLQRRIPVIATPWGSDLLLPHLQGDSISDWFQRGYYGVHLRIIIRLADFFICDAQHLRFKLIEMGVPDKRIQLIYFGTDVEKFSPINRDLDFRMRNGAFQNHVVILSNRILNDDVYQISLILHATKIVLSKSHRSEFVVWIVGGGPHSESLRHLSQNLGLDGTVRFLGRLDDHDFMTATASCDIYVSTSPTDGGLSASVAEAMSSERPVIISDFGDNASWLDNESAGYLFSKGDAFDLANKISLLIENPHGRSQMGNQGRKIISTRNNATIETQRVIERYKRVVNDRSQKMRK